MVGSHQDSTQNTDGGDVDTDKEIQVDQDGDLVLCAGGQTSHPAPRSFRVCASALRRCSPVWKRMLFGPFREAKPAFGEWVVDLPEDEPEALGVLLHIVHANFLLVPTAPALGLLYEILRFAEKYDMIGVVKPWAAAWLEVAEGATTEAALNGRSTALNGRSTAALAYIAWELGQIELQRRMMRELVLHSAIDKDGRMVTADGVVLDEFDPIGPPGLVGWLRRQQQEIFKTLPLQLNSVIRELTDGPGCCVSKTSDQYIKANCNDIILGSLFRHMARERSSVTLTLVGNEGESAAQLSASIRSIAENVSTYDGHVKCNPGGKIVSMLGKNTKARVIKLNKASIEKMNKRREDLGLEKSTPPKASE